MSLQDPRIRSFDFIWWGLAEIDSTGGIDRSVEVLCAGVTAGLTFLSEVEDQAGLDTHKRYGASISIRLSLPRSGS